jgi:hypothetical protein
MKNTISILPKDSEKVAYGVLQDSQINRAAKQVNSKLTAMEETRVDSPIGDCSKRTFMLSLRGASSFHERAFNLFHLAARD